MKDWWGADLPVHARAEQFRHACATNIYRDRDVGLRGLQGGKNYLFREEFTSRTWATRYDFPALKDGRVKQRRCCPTTRRPARRAGSSTRGARSSRTRACARRSIYAFDFEWTNKNIMFGAYKRTHLGLPELRHDGGGQARRRTSSRCSSRSAARCRTKCSASRSCRRSPTARARTARCCARPTQLLQRGRLRDQGRQARRCRTASRSTIEFLIDEPTFQPHHMPFIKNLDAARHRGDARASSIRCSTARASTTSISTSRSQRFSFSIDAGRFAAHLFLVAGGRDANGSHNLAGIADPAVDALIDTIIAAETRAELDHRLPRARPRAPRRPLLDPALVQGVALDRLLGRVRLSAEKAAIMPAAFRRPGGTIRTRRRSSSGRR